MGTFYHPVAISATPQGPFREMEALVDTGSLYTWVPQSILRELGVISTGRRQFILADGSLIERDIAWVTIRINGETSPTICVFGDEGTTPLLGAVTLEEFALVPDLVNRRLMPMPHLPLLSSRV